MKKYKVEASYNLDKLERCGVVYDWVITPALGFFDEDYNGEEYVWCIIFEGAITTYHYNPDKNLLTEETVKINEIISWISLGTIYNYSHSSKDTVYLYGYSIERHNGKSYRFATEVKNKRVFYSSEKIELYKGGQKW